MQLPKVDYDLLRLEGGLDLLTPSLALAPGYCRDAQNFEVSVNSGYTRIPGYERFDGRTAPSAATWGALVLDAAANVSVGQTVAGPDGSAQVVAIADTTLIYTKQVGAFSATAIANAIRNSGMIGAPGGTTLPAFWAYDPSTTGLSYSVTGTGVEGGLPYVDIRFFGTAATNGFVALFFELPTEIAASDGETWTGSYYMRLVGGTAAGLLVEPNFGINEFTAGVFVTGAQGASVTPTSTVQRVTYTRLLSVPAVDTLYPYLLFNPVSGAAVDMTLRLSCPQMEQRAAASPPVVTTGAAAIGDRILRAGLPVGAVTATAAAFDARTQAQYQALAAGAYRADIQAVPGSGPVRGVLAYSGEVFAWRNNAAGTAMDIYRSTNGGWSQVTLGSELVYTVGNAVIAEGSTVTGATSGATGVVRRQLVRTGTVGGSTAAGTLVLTATTGTFASGENLQVGGITRAVSGGAAAPIVLAAGGRVQTVVGNFGAGTRIYGCDSVNRGFEFDGAYYVPIRTGMADDTPTSVAVHNSTLFFAFGSSVQFSSINAPFTWSPTLGAGEFLARESVTGMVSMLGSDATSSLVIYARDSTSVLYGTNSGNYQLAPFGQSAGAEKYTPQRMETIYALDERGVMSLAATDKFGNFDTATLTYNIRPWIQGRRTSATASGINREKSQYRVFFSDGSGLYITIVNGEYMGSMPVYFPNPVNVWCEGEIGSGVETSYFGSANGFVYRLDVGPSFDGLPIEGRLQLNYNPSKAPRIRKRYRRASVEVTGSAFAEFSFGYDLGYGLPDNEQPIDETYQNRFQSSNWDNFFWDLFTWDGRTLAPSEVEMTGTAENVAIRISTGTNYIEEFTLNSVILHFSMRRGLR